jgi:hypothetical protein
MMRSHGRFKVARQINIVQVDFFNSWNEEAAMEYAEAIRMYGQEISPQPWAVLGDLRFWELGTPESLAVISSLAAELDNMNRRHTALVVADNDLKRAVLDEALGQDAKRQIAFFDGKQAARHWLCEQGYGAVDQADSEPIATQA